MTLGSVGFGGESVDSLSEAHTTAHLGTARCAPGTNIISYRGVCHGFAIANRGDSAATGRFTDLAVQSKLGLWPERRTRSSPGNFARLVASWISSSGILTCARR